MSCHKKINALKKKKKKERIILEITKIITHKPLPAPAFPDYPQAKAYVK